MPSGFNDFTGDDTLATKTYNGNPFYLAFGSELDSKTSRCAERFNSYIEARKHKEDEDDEEDAQQIISVFEILRDYFDQVAEIAKPIVWAQALAIKNRGTIDFNLDKFNALLFGECGAGKSTALSLIARIYAELYPIASRNEMMTFEHAKSIKSVTTQVR